MSVFLEKKIKLTYAGLSPFCFVYAALPVIIFVATWLKVWIALLAVVITVVGLVSACRQSVMRGVFDSPAEDIVSRRVAPLLSARRGASSGDASRHALLSPAALVCLVAIALAWCFFAGQGGYWYQSYDWLLRNALFRDLLTYDWPVIYHDGAAAMSYYIAYWLPAALPGHLLYSAGLSLDAVWALSNVLLFVWTFLGVFLVELLVVCLLKPRHFASILLCGVGLVLFSTPDAIGMVLAGSVDYVIPRRHLEFWAYYAQISSLTTCLFWVFNQTVISWVCTLCFLQESSLRNYVFLGVCCFASGPLPCVGLFVLMLVVGLAKVIRPGQAAVGVRHPFTDGGKAAGAAHVRRRSWRFDHPHLASLCSIASIQNLMYLIVVLVFLCFFLINSAVSHTGTMATSDNLLTYPLWFPSDPDAWRNLALFVLVEGLLLPLLIFRDHGRMPLFWAVTITLCCVAFVRVGGGTDFCMRVSIPAVIVLYVLCLESLRRGVARVRASERPKRVLDGVLLGALTVVLLAGVATPCMEFYRGFEAVAENGGQAPVQDYGTLADVDFSASNFGSNEYADTLFFRYLAR